MLELEKTLLTSYEKDFGIKFPKYLKELEKRMSETNLEFETNQRRGGRGKPRPTRITRISLILSKLKLIDLCSPDKNKTFDAGHLKADLGSNSHTLTKDLDDLFCTKNIIQVCHFKRGKSYGQHTYYYLSDFGKETLGHIQKTGL